jgi:hypothetical protein
MSPVKEPLFFAIEGEKQLFRGPRDDQGIRELDAYLELFRKADGKAIGEASPLYLFSEKAVHRIKYYIPRARLIAILRNPVDRAYSHFLQHRLAEREKLSSFREALRAEKKRAESGWSPFWSYCELGFYGRHLDRYKSIFSGDQIKIVLYEDLQNQPQTTFRSIIEFLGLNESCTVAMPVRQNVSGYPRFRGLHLFLKKPNVVRKILKPYIPERARARLKDSLVKKITNLNLRKPHLSPQDRHLLIEQYREDILRTQDIIKRDLSSWLAI